MTSIPGASQAEVLYIQKVDMEILIEYSNLISKDSSQSEIGKFKERFKFFETYISSSGYEQKKALLQSEEGTKFIATLNLDQN